MSNVAEYHEPGALIVPASWGRIIAAPFIWFVPAIVFTIIVGVCSGLIVFTPVFLVLGPLAALLWAYLINRVVRGTKRQRAMIVLGYVETAARLNLPLNEFLLAAELSERGGMRRQLHSLRQALMRGYPVGSALAGTVAEFPENIAAEAGAAERVGQLQPALSRIMEEHGRSKVFINDDLSDFYHLYPVAICSAIFTLLAFYLIFIMPKFQEIFKDFRTNLPPITQFVIKLGALFYDGPIPFLGIAVILLVPAMVVATGLQLQRIFTPYWQIPGMRGVRDWISWHTPLWRGMERDHGLAAACRVAADGVRAGMPLTGVVEQTLSLSINRHLKKRLSRWRERMAAGAPIAQAAAEAGLPEILVGFLASAQTPKAASEEASLADIFEFMARYFAGRLSRAVLLIRAAFEPLAVLCMGVIVAVFVLSMFVPLVKLINSVMGTDPGGLL